MEKREIAALLREAANILDAEIDAHLAKEEDRKKAEEEAKPIAFGTLVNTPHGPGICLGAVVGQPSVMEVVTKAGSANIIERYHTSRLTITNP